MDRYLFRGLRTDGEGWVYGNLNVFYDKEWTFIKEQDVLYGTMTQVIPETVGQWTGLVDKRGVKIFEGDIVASEIEEFSGAIRYTVEDAGYSLEMSEENRLYDLDALYTYEVIGNIHQK